MLIDGKSRVERVLGGLPGTFKSETYSVQCLASSLQEKVKNKCKFLLNFKNNKTKGAQTK